jgi:hypothetical protein
VIVISDGVWVVVPGVIARIPVREINRRDWIKRENAVLDDGLQGMVVLGAVRHNRDRRVDCCHERRARTRVRAVMIDVVDVQPLKASGNQALDVCDAFRGNAGEIPGDEIAKIAVAH